MSTWGGIGEGLTAGMNARIALEEQRRKDRQAQENADREFRFKQQQAERAQANADRTFEAGREDAANAQANADRTFTEGVRRADMAQANADREFDLEVDKAQIGVDQAERELALKEQNQSWDNKLNEEKLKSFRLANEKLDREERQAKMIDDAKRESGREQLAAAIYRVTGSGGQEQTITVKENGQDVQKKVRVLPQSAREQIFGKDGFFKDVQNVVSFEDENGNTVAALVKPDGTMQMFTPEQQYDIYSGAFGKSFADEQMRAVGEKKDLGMFAAKEQAKATAQVKAREASDPYDRKRQIDAATAILRSEDASDGDRAAALAYLGSVFNKDDSSTANPTTGIGRVQTPEEAARARAALEQKRTAQKRITAPTAQKKVEQKVDPKKEATKPTEKKVEQKPTEQKKKEPKKAPIPIQRKRRHGSETSSGSAFEINEEAVAARMKREREEMEKRERDREEFYRRMNSGPKGASVSKRHN